MRRVIAPTQEMSNAMIIGYARVSTGEQRLDLQIQALEHAGCDQIFTDHGQSGSRFGREGLGGALEALTPGCTLVVWRLDRLGRSLSGLVALLEQLGERDVDFLSITESINTASSGGKLMFHMMAALAEFERSLISERTRAGMAAAKANGKSLGRPRILTNDQLISARHAIDVMNLSPSKVSAALNVSSRTLSRHLEKMSV